MSTINFSYDPEWLDTLSAPFMTNAFIAGLCIALAAGVMGYFTIARRSTFAAHALAHIGLPGATGAVLLGLPVSLGMGVFALGGALVKWAGAPGLFATTAVLTALWLVLTWPLQPVGRNAGGGH